MGDIVKDKEELLKIKEEADFLNNYDAQEYEKPSVATDIVIFRMANSRLEVLMIRRKNPPYKGYLAFPGGFVGIDESTEEAAYRELLEETNVKDVYLEQLYTFSKPDRDPRMRIISVAYMALVRNIDLNEMAGDDAADVVWLGVNDLLRDLENGDIDLAFDHEIIFKKAIERMRGKIDYTDIAFQLISDEFTISELQRVHEEVLNKKLHSPNFRRTVLPMLIETDRYDESKRARPAKYYKRK